MIRGGEYESNATELAASARTDGYTLDPYSGDYVGTGFRLAMIPEPGTGLLVIGGLLCLAGWRRARC